MLLKKILAVVSLASVLLGSKAEATRAQQRAHLPAVVSPVAMACDAGVDYGDGNGLALAGNGTLYVALGPADGAGRSAAGITIQQRSASGRLLGAWMTPGARPGQALHPAGIAIDSHGDIYVADAAAGHVLKVSASGRVLATWGATGAAPGRFERPAGLAVDRHGDVYVADKGNGRIQVFNAAGQLRAVWRLPAVSRAQPSLPTGIAVDRHGLVYVADEAVRILVLSPQGKVLRVWGSKGDAPDQFRHPVGIALDPEGRLDIADKLNARIQRFTAAGTPINRWATGGAAGGWFPAQGVAPVQPAYPTGVAVAPSGTIYVLAGWCPSRLQTFTPGGRTLAIWPISVQ